MRGSTLDKIPISNVIKQKLTFSKGVTESCNQQTMHESLLTKRFIKHLHLMCYMKKLYNE